MGSRTVWEEIKQVRGPGQSTQALTTEEESAYRYEKLAAGRDTQQLGCPSLS